MWLIRRSLPNPLCRSLYLILHSRVEEILITRGALSSHLCRPPVRRNASSTNRLISTSNFSNSEATSDVASLLRDYGFSSAQISSIEKQRSRVFWLRAGRDLLPKLHFLGSIGLSNGDIHKIITRNPRMLGGSLANQLIPCYDFLRSIPLDNQQIRRILIWFPGIILTNVKTVLDPNLLLLRENGINQAAITSLMLHATPTACRVHEKFKTFFHRAVAMGLQPSASKFIEALHAIGCVNKDKWERKVSLFKKYGLVDDDISFIFQRKPSVMSLSEINIGRSLEFFINELSCSPAMIVHNPVVLQYSFERRVVPRCRVMEKLVKEGLALKLSPPTYLGLTDEDFLDRFIHGNKEKLPELLDIHPQWLN